MTTTYIYASGNLLADRNTYAYTAFHGEQFFKDWRQNRDATLALLPTPVPAPRASPIRSLERVLAESVYNTDEFLEALLAKVQQHDLDSLSDQLLAELVKRFEVTKRIHAAYSTHWRATDKAAYNSMDLYVRYGELMQAAYVQTKRLEYLNVFLKVLDTLVTLVEQLSSNQAGRLASLLIAEEDFIHGLLELRK